MLDFTKNLENFKFESYLPKYASWKEEHYLKSGLKWCEPMTAHALEDDETQSLALSTETNYIEEKFDGTRGVLHFLKDECRVFSRRVSKKTNWFTENTDSLPQMRFINIPELEGTILDGEMFIPDRPFKDVSSTLNCKWDKAISRQQELGEIVFHAFDIMYYKGIKLENMKLVRRKHYLSKVISKLQEYGITCIVEVPYFQCGEERVLPNGDVLRYFIPVKDSRETLLKIKGIDTYETLYKELHEQFGSYSDAVTLSPKGYYEYIVATGGEGVIIKDQSSKYVHKRDKAYLKIKKFYTREVVILGFTEPTKEYKGKFPNDSWDYWEYSDNKGNIVTSNNWGSHSAKDLVKKGYKPITKYYFENWVGNIIFGVVITDKEIETLPKNKKFNIKTLYAEGSKFKVLEVGECAGFDENVREELTKGFVDDEGNNKTYIGSVIEVKCNEIFKDTGKLRHPRFLRFRSDKSPLDCTYLNHITE